jgi:hypothetical protein
MGRRYGAATAERFKPLISADRPTEVPKMDVKNVLSVSLLM